MSFAVLRWILGAFCIFFAPALGRSMVRYRQGRERPSKLLAWALRVLLTAAAVCFRSPVDRTTVIVFSLAILLVLAGAYYEFRPKHEEELQKIMFPPE